MVWLAVMFAKVFISSVIAGYSDRRDAAAAAIKSVNCEVVRSEDFAALPESPQTACLNGVRASDVVVCVLGGRYGAKQASGISATHEECREALLSNKPLLVFVEDAVDRDSDQAAFLREIETWESGHMRKSFNDAEDLRTKITQALSKWLHTEYSRPVDVDEIYERAEQLLPNQHNGIFQGPRFAVAVASGPKSTVIRPSELEDDRFHKDLLQVAQYGMNSILGHTSATDMAVDQPGQLIIRQKHRRVVLDADMTTLIEQSVEPDKTQRRLMIPVIVEEVLCASLARSLRFAAQLLDMCDSTGRLTHVVPLVSLYDVMATPWMTQAEYEASRDSFTMNANRSGIIVRAEPNCLTRSHLAAKADRIAEDVCAVLRQSGKNRGPF